MSATPTPANKTKKGTKAYHHFTDLEGNHHGFDNYMDFAKWWFSFSTRARNHYLSPETIKKLQYAAANSKEARTPVSPAGKFIR